MSHKFLYIAAPMTGYEDWNRPAIERMVKFLTDNYSDKVIPLHTAWLPLGYPYERYMDVSYNLIERADAILLLNGWRDSPGCCREVEYALMIGIEHFLEQSRWGTFWELQFLPTYQKGTPVHLEALGWLYD